MSDKQIRDWRKMIVTKIGMIHTKADQTAKMFHKDCVTIASFEGICNELKSPVEVWMNAELKNLVEKLNDCFGTISEVATSFAIQNGEDYIPVAYIKILVDKSLEDLKPLLKLK